MTHAFLKNHTQEAPNSPFHKATNVHLYGWFCLQDSKPCTERPLRQKAPYFIFPIHTYVNEVVSLIFLLRFSKADLAITMQHFSISFSQICYGALPELLILLIYTHYLYPSEEDELIIRSVQKCLRFQWKTPVRSKSFNLKYLGSNKTVYWIKINSHFKKFQKTQPNLLHSQLHFKKHFDYSTGIFLSVGIKKFSLPSKHKVLYKPVFL